MDDDISDDEISICCSDSDLWGGVIYLTRESYDQVLELIRNPPPPTEALKRLMRGEEVRLKRTLPTDPSGR